MRGHKQPLQRPPRHPDIGVLPELEKVDNAHRNGRFQKGHPKNEEGKYDLGDTEDQDLEEAGPEPGEPVELFDGMVPAVSRPQAGEVMHRTVDPVTGEVDAQRAERKLGPRRKGLHSFKDRRPIHRSGILRHLPQETVDNRNEKHSRREPQNVQRPMDPAVYILSGHQPFGQHKTRHQHEVKGRGVNFPDDPE